MKIDGISSLVVNSPDRLETKAINPIETSFATWMDAIQKMDTNQTQAKHKMMQVLSGQSDDVHGALLAIEKNNFDMQVAVAVRDKAISGIQKLLDLQI
jgi:flagellar hook-basal body complex protein FliE